MTDSPAGLPKRERLIAAAITLFHEQGVERTTLAEIAEAAEVPPGNVYYYFKAKDDVVAAVIAAHAERMHATLAAIETANRSPKTRLKALMRMLASQSEVVARHGCPLGSLCSELDKRLPEGAIPSAPLMQIPIEWAAEQFRSLGRRDATDLAIDLMAAYEGGALLANTLRDAKLLAGIGRRVEHWIDAL
jgi:TetR/AcrR family transcriptional repressor of nem operon